MSKAVLVGEQKKLLKRKCAISEFFEEMVQLKPNDVAVLDGEKYYTYQEYNELSNRIARTLLNYEIAQKDVVAIRFEKSIHMMAAIMAIMKIGAVYVPIGLTIPPDRVEYILRDSKASLLLLQDRSMSIETEKDILIYNEVELDKGTDNINTKFSGLDIAYILYTSGSTGEPKGVKVQHEAVINHILWRVDCSSSNADDVFFLKTPYTFDISIWEMFLWFFVGAKVSICSEGKERNADYILTEICNKKISICQFVPSMLLELLKFAKHRDAVGKLSSLRLVFSGGEVLHFSVVEKFRDILTKQYGTLLYNVYGPTETTIDSTYFCCTNNEREMEMRKVVPIGFPIWNTNVYIIDEQGRVCDEGVEGEIVVAGKGVAIGYVGDVQSDAFAKIGGLGAENTYRTGDVGRVVDGYIEFCGRRDEQIKIRGMRVELEEIEARINSINEIQKAAVCYEEKQEHGRLVAVYVASTQIEANTIKEYLCRFLPDYMVPDYYKQVEKLFYTSSGKIDRGQIEKKYLQNLMDNNVCSEIAYSEALSQKERDVLQVIIENMKINGVVSQETTLIDLGINSLKFIGLIVELEEAFDIVLDVEMLLPNQYPTVYDMVKYVASLI